MIKSWQRAHLRAPLKQEVLYVDDGYVLKASSLNISETGMLMESFPSIPQSRQFEVMFSLPLLPSFHRWGVTKLLKNEIIQDEADIIQAKCHFTRSEKSETEVDKIMSTRIGLKLEYIDQSDRAKVMSFVELMSRNIVFVLNIFQQSDGAEEEVQLLHKLGAALGHGRNIELTLLRQKILHDYQGLESL